jgi:hypothetical protein
VKEREGKKKRNISVHKMMEYSITIEKEKRNKKRGREGRKEGKQYREVGGFPEGGNEKMMKPNDQKIYIYKKEPPGLWHKRMTTKD